MFQQLLDIATRISQELFGHCWVERRKVMVEYGRFGGKKVEKEGREGRRINIEDCYPELPRRWRAAVFCSPSQKVLNEDERSGFPNDDLTYLLFLVFQ